MRVPGPSSPAAVTWVGPRVSLQDVVLLVLLVTLEVRRASNVGWRRIRVSLRTLQGFLAAACGGCHPRTKQRGFNGEELPAATPWSIAQVHTWLALLVADGALHLCRVRAPTATASAS